MGRRGSGVEVRDTSIRISFTLDGTPQKHTLKTNGAPMAPTAANIKYAHRLADEIRQKIRFGTFKAADYFPDSATASTASVPTVGEQLALWLKLQNNKAASTVKGYSVAATWWTQQIGAKLLPALRHSDVLSALATEPEWSGKTRNNKVSVLRLALDLAVRDGLLLANPTAGIEAASHQSPEPDPFSREEAEAIIAGLAKHYSEAVSNYFGAKFYTGLRTSESLAQQWGWLDTRQNVLAVSEAVVLGQLKKSTKTSKVRLVQLNSRALEFYQAQKAHSFLLPEGWIFPDPKTQQRWADDWTPREMYWRPCLKKLGIRYRSPYETRHTYATMLLMAGVTPAFAARQMGHSIQMFLTTYARWIDGGQNALEMGKLENLIAPPAPPAKASGTP